MNLAIEIEEVEFADIVSVLVLNGLAILAIDRIGSSKKQDVPKVIP
jgi:hypothetical protein